MSQNMGSSQHLSEMDIVLLIVVKICMLYIKHEKIEIKKNFKIIVTFPSLNIVLVFNLLTGENE